MPFDKETAAAAGRKSTRGEGVKSKQWKALGDFITQEGAARAMKILNEMPEEQYLEQYGKLLNYFKPRMQSAQVETKGEININIVEPD